MENQEPAVDGRIAITFNRRLEAAVKAALAALLPLGPDGRPHPAAAPLQTFHLDHGGLCGRISVPCIGEVRVDVAVAVTPDG